MNYYRVLVYRMMLYMLIIPRQLSLRTMLLVLAHGQAEMEEFLSSSGQQARNS